MINNWLCLLKNVCIWQLGYGFLFFYFIEISKIETPRYTGRIQLGYYGMTRFLCFSLFMFDVPSIHNVCSNLQPFLSIMFVLVQVSNHKFFKFPHNTLHSYFSTTSSFFKRVNLESSFEDLRWLRIDCVFLKMYAFDNLDMFFYFLFFYWDHKNRASRYTGCIQLGYYGMTRFLCFSRIFKLQPCVKFWPL